MWNPEALRSPPLLTADLPGIGGRIKGCAEDFEVEEIPAYAPCGRGDFLFLWIEKRDMGAEYFARQVALRLGISAADVGMAGLKDRHAVTRQMISVPAKTEDRLSCLDGDGIHLLSAERHTNKLRAGHLRGNRFRVTVRDLSADPTDRLAPLMARLSQQGMPNFYGPQRFGRDGETAYLGLRLLGAQGDLAGGARETGLPRSRFLRKLALSAAQSLLFNRYLARRMEENCFRTVQHGDVMAKIPNGALFVASVVTAEQARFEARETVHTGPVFGRKMFPAEHEAASREASVLAEAGMSNRSFAGFGKLLQGTRRANLVYPEPVARILAPDCLQLTFALPAGTYATVFLQEIMKTLPANSARDESAVD